MFIQQPLRLALRKHQRVGVRRGHSVETHVSYLLAALNYFHARSLTTCFDQGPATAGGVQQFQRPAPQHECLRFIRTLCRLIDDADRDAVSGKANRHR
jgi:hypothetical protein